MEQNKGTGRVQEEIDTAENLVDGYEAHPEVGEKKRIISESVMKDHVGVDFKLVAVALQVINGVDYIFIYTGTLTVPHPQTKLYAVKIFTKLGNGASILEVQGIDEADVASLTKQSVRNNRTMS